VQTPATLKAAPDYHLDALRVATANGPAPECTKVPSVSYGYGPVTGTLDEQHSAVSAVLPTAGFDRFGLEITDTTGAATTAVATLYNSSWNKGCSPSTSGTQCSAGGSSSAASPSLFLLSLQGGARHPGAAPLSFLRPGQARPASRTAKLTRGTGRSVASPPGRPSGPRSRKSAGHHLPPEQDCPTDTPGTNP
jgi:hypothetical protein